MNEKTFMISLFLIMIGYLLICLYCFGCCLNRFWRKFLERKRAKQAKHSPDLV